VATSLGLLVSSILEEGRTAQDPNMIKYIRENFTRSQMLWLVQYATIELI
jgi:hypothetical protein